MRLRFSVSRTSRTFALATDSSVSGMSAFAMSSEPGAFMIEAAKR